MENDTQQNAGMGGGDIGGGGLDAAIRQGAASTPGGDTGSTQTSTPPPTPAVSLTPDTIKAILDGLPKPVAQSQPQPKMTDEELERALNVYKVREEQLAALGYDDTIRPNAVKFFNEHAAGTAKWASTLAALQVNQARQAIMQELAPVIQFARESQERQLRDEFISSNPDLKGYEPLLEAVYAQLSSQGMRFNSKDEAFKAVAEVARQTIKKLPGSSGGQQSTGSAQPRGHKMSTVMTGGPSTSGGNTEKVTPSQQLARRLFFSGGR